MKINTCILVITISMQVHCLYAQKSISHLQKVGDQYQLMVNEKPFIMLAGELGNSTASTMESMEAVWPRLNELNLNKTACLAMYLPG